jgi:hypothetical protein
MKKLYLIRYTYKNKDKEYEEKHFEDVYYLCARLSEAIKDIESKFNEKKYDTKTNTKKFILQQVEISIIQ